jgi:hypothetical protein
VCGREVLTAGEAGIPRLRELLADQGLVVIEVAPGGAIPGSYWGAPEAGLAGARLYIRGDTPVHSVLHEAAHFICMEPERRATLARDAGGDFAEENAVCYLQVVLADAVPGMGRERMCSDMDAWGYTFRLGSARRWFEEDAEDAREWLERRGLLGA